MSTASPPNSLADFEEILDTLFDERVDFTERIEALNPDEEETHITLTVNTIWRFMRTLSRSIEALDHAVERLKRYEGPDAESLPKESGSGDPSPLPGPDDPCPDLSSKFPSVFDRIRHSEN